MKLSEAMMLGDSLRERTNSLFLSPQGEKFIGCAIGGALLAIGAGRAKPTGETNYEAIRKNFPWLMDENGGRAWQARIGFGPTLSLFKVAYPEPSFHKVMIGECTFEQLVDYVRSVEPECGECNSFACTCQKPVTEPEPKPEPKPVTEEEVHETV